MDDLQLLNPRSRKAVIAMSVLRLCEHQFDLLVKAVAAYKPANDEKDDYTLLVDYLAEKSREDAFWDEELRPEDIPF